jgi:hypothetical protein
VSHDGCRGLVGRSVQLRPVLPQDVGHLYRLAMGPDEIWRWRLRGRTPSPSDFETFLWTASDLQFIVERVDGGQVCGHVCSYQTDELGATTKVAMITDGGTGPRSWPIEGGFLFLQHLFSAFPLRKVYFEVPAFNLSRLRAFLDRYTIEEGRLRDHVFGEARFCDLVVAAMWRYHWNDLETSTLGRALRPAVES